MVSPGDTHSLKIMEFLSGARIHRDIHKSAAIPVFRLDVSGKPPKSKLYICPWELSSALCTPVGRPSLGLLSSDLGGLPCEVEKHLHGILWDFFQPASKQKPIIFTGSECNSILQL